MSSKSFARQVRGVAALDHPVSLHAYGLVLERGWVGRDEAGEALGVGRTVAAFHLDKLVKAGLLNVRYERLSGRSGPGAGRPAKLYGRSEAEIELSIPARRYDLAGSVLAEAVTRAEDESIPVGEAVSAVAEETGERLGKQACAGHRHGQAALLDLLAQHGYEPRRHGRDIALVNCPFHAIAEQHRNLVCGMNADLLSGVVHAIGSPSMEAVLAPEPGYCCVRIRPKQ